jgi:hypothetical protein
MTKNNLVGWIAILFGLLLGAATIYGSFWWCIVCNLTDFIGYCKEDPISRIHVFWCIVKFFVLSSLIASVGSLATFFVLVFGVACTLDGKNHVHRSRIKLDN